MTMFTEIPVHVFNANFVDPDQTLSSVATDLGLLCFLITLVGVSRLKWDKQLLLFITKFTD